MARKYFTFSQESSFNLPNFTRQFAVDITNERLQKLKNYENIFEFGKLEAAVRHTPHQHVRGQLISELTLDNKGWSYITGTLLGSRTEISGYKFSELPSKEWKILIGYLAADLDTDSTSFEITEGDVGDFNSVDAVIINSEFMTIDSISNGTVSQCTRAQGGTIAADHGQKDLVYGIVADPTQKIVITHRLRQSGFVKNNLSLSAVVDRDSILYGYSGLYVEEMTFNFRTFDPITATMNFFGADSTNNLLLDDSTASDDGAIIGLEDVFVFSEHQAEELRQFYIDIQNSLTVGSYGFDGIPQGFLFERASTYGEIIWIDPDLEKLLLFEDNTKKHFSISMANATGTYRMVFALNDVRINTVSHNLDNDLFVINDPAPWYMYTPPVIMYQMEV